MNKFRIPAALVASAALGLGLAACSSSGDSSGNTTPPAQGGSSVAAAGAAGSACPDGTLTFGVEPYEDPATLTPLYQALGNALGTKLGCKVEVQIAQSYVAEILAMKAGKLDIGEFGPLGFVFASQQAGALPVASFADADGKVSSYTAGIWVKKGSPLTKIEDLKGKKLALSEAGSTSGDAVPREALVKAGIDKDVTVNYAGGHPQAQLALMHGQVDAAEINSQQLASSTKAGKFKAADYTEIWKSDPILNDPIAVSPTLSPEAQKAISDGLLGLGSADVKGLGDLLDFTSPATKPLVAVTADDYKPLFSLAKTLGLTTKDLG